VSRAGHPIGWVAAASPIVEFEDGTLPCHTRATKAATPSRQKQMQDYGVMTTTAATAAAFTSRAAAALAGGSTAAAPTAPAAAPAAISLGVTDHEGFGTPNQLPGSWATAHGCATRLPIILCRSSQQQ
jgi:hypothetical protein